MSLTNDPTSQISNAISGVSSLDRYTLESQNASSNSGFSAPPVPSADNNGLPSSNVPYNIRNFSQQRNMVHFFVPEVGTVSMYINPQSINYSFEKVISQERTKGGYSLQYWGETLPTIRLSGHTGSSGVEGINVLYEVYRSEQYVFDSIGLTIASNNSVSGLSDLSTNLLGNTVGSLTNGLFDLNPISQSILPRNIPTLASMAFTVEMYYSGWVFRGYFKSFGFNESADRLGIFNYDIDFVVTQRRGYRTNSLPWQHSATSGPSNNGQGGIPYTFDGTTTY